MTEICQLDDIPDGGAKAIRVNDLDLVLVRRGDAVHAVIDRCPHQGAPLSAGVVTCRRAAGQVGEYRSEKDGLIVRCPWHNWEIDVTDGSVSHSGRIRLMTFAVSVNNGVVSVDV